MVSLWRWIGIGALLATATLVLDYERLVQSYLPASIAFAFGRALLGAMLGGVAFAVYRRFVRRA